MLSKTEIAKQQWLDGDQPCDVDFIKSLTTTEAALLFMRLNTVFNVTIESDKNAEIDRRGVKWSIVRKLLILSDKVSDFIDEKLNEPEAESN